STRLCPRKAVLVNIDPAPIYMEAMYESMSGDKDAVVQVCACKTLTSLATPGPQKASSESFGSRYHLVPSVWARVRPCRQRLGLADSRQYPAGWFRRRGQRGAATDDAAKGGQKAG